MYFQNQINCIALPIITRAYLITAFLLLQVSCLFSQAGGDTSTINTSEIVANKNLSSKCFFYSDPTASKTIKEISTVSFSEKLDKIIPSRRRIPNKYISAENYISFTLKNNNDSAESFYLCAGNYLRVFDIYKITNGIISPNSLYKKIETNEYVINHGYKLIQLAPGETSAFLLKLGYVKTTVNNLNPRIVRPQYAVQQVVAEINLTDVLGIITFIISGFFLLMIFYSIANYRQAYRAEFLYYAGYTFCVGILLFLKAILSNNSTWFNFFFEGYFDFFIQLASVFLYLLFIRSYLNTKNNYPFIETILAFSKWIVIGALSLYTYVYFGTNNFNFQNTIELYTKLYLVLLGIIFIITGLRYKDKLLKYLVYGNINLIFFGLISLFFIVSTVRFTKIHWIFSNSLLYYDLSVVGECILFMAGLSYKNRKELIEKVKMQEAIKLEKERQQMEKQLTIINAQQEERNRISADMHDELGAGMTAIRLMSEMAKVKTADNPITEIDKISDSANDLLNKMNAIIWSMNSSNDTLPNLVSYIRSYAITYFENLDIKCRIDINDEVPEKELYGEKRRNIFLTVKEALNNIVKHSKATAVVIDFSFEKNICIKIQDNGIGINHNKLREFGNGLKNMRKRMESMGGNFETHNNVGTTIKLCIPFDYSLPSAK